MQFVKGYVNQDQTSDFKLVRVTKDSVLELKLYRRVVKVINKVDSWVSVQLNLFSSSINVIVSRMFDLV